MKNTSPLTPKRAFILVGILVFVLTIFYIYDFCTYANRIHNNVFVGDLDLGNLTIEEASAKIDERYQGEIDSAPVYFHKDGIENFSEDDAYKITYSDLYTVKEDEDDFADTQGANSKKHDSFKINSEILNVKSDGAFLANQAYTVGKGDDFFLGSLGVSLFGNKRDMSVSFDAGLLVSLMDYVTLNIGNPVADCDIKYIDDSFVSIKGSDGNVVNGEDFKSKLSKAFISTQRQFDLNMKEKKMLIGIDDAQRAANQANEAIAKPITLSYNNKEWILEKGELVDCIGTFSNEPVFGSELKCYIDIDNAKAVINALINGDIKEIPAKSAKFLQTGKNLSIVEGKSGNGVDFDMASAGLNLIMFGDATLSYAATNEKSPEAFVSSIESSVDSQTRTINLGVSTVQPEFTSTEAAALGIDKLIKTYSLEFSGLSDGSIHNMKLLSKILDNTIVKNDEIFSINETAGECDEEKGFVGGGSIVNGELVDEIGGGICRVASAVYGAAFKAGFPITERHNHSQYIPSYPDGMDAGISWPNLDLKFKNDSGGSIVVLCDANDNGVTVNIWGSNDPGCIVKTKKTDWKIDGDFTTRKVNSKDYPDGYEEVSQTGRKGMSITVTRFTYFANGELKSKEEFDSVYQPRTEIITIGTGKKK